MLTKLDCLGLQTILLGDLNFNISENHSSHVKKYFEHFSVSWTRKIDCQFQSQLLIIFGLSQEIY